MSGRWLIVDLYLEFRVDIPSRHNKSIRKQLFDIVVLAVNLMFWTLAIRIDLLLALDLNRVNSEYVGGFRVYLGKAIFVSFFGETLLTWVWFCLRAINHAYTLSLMLYQRTGLCFVACQSKIYWGFNTSVHWPHVAREKTFLDLWEKTHLSRVDLKEEIEHVGLAVETQEKRREAVTASREETHCGRRPCISSGGICVMGGRAQDNVANRWHSRNLLQGCVWWD